MVSSKRIIKKYPNRRLYDTSLGSYITLDDIKNLVCDRVDFQVIDARSKKDLTQSTLLQIIAEQEANDTPIFTTPMLQDLIRFYQHKSQTLLSKYLEEAMHVFLQQKEFFKQQMHTYEEAWKLLKPGVKPEKNSPPSGRKPTASKKI